MYLDCSRTFLLYIEPSHHSKNPWKICKLLTLARQKCVTIALAKALSIASCRFHPSTYDIQVSSHFLIMPLLWLGSWTFILFMEKKSNNLPLRWFECHFLKWMCEYINFTNKARYIFFHLTALCVLSPECYGYQNIPFTIEILFSLQWRI